MTDTKSGLRSYIEQYLAKAVLMQVATASGNQPWACSVYFAFDEKLQLYWISGSDRRHSTEIRNNQKVAGVVVLPHTPGDAVRGIQFQGCAYELTEKQDVAVAMGYYAKRFGMDEARVAAIVDNTDGHLCYKVQPVTFVLFDEVNFPVNPRQVYSL